MSSNLWGAGKRLQRMQYLFFLCHVCEMKAFKVACLFVKSHAYEENRLQISALKMFARTINGTLKKSGSA